MENPPTTAHDQFIVSAVTGVAGGKNEKRIEIIRKTAENTFTGSPNFPIDHGPYLISSLLAFLMIISVMGIRYDMKRPASVMDTRALKAAVDPMLIKASRHGMIVHSTIARSGKASDLFTLEK